MLPTEWLALAPGRGGARLTRYPRRSGQRSTDRKWDNDKFGRCATPAGKRASWPPTRPPLRRTDAHLPRPSEPATRRSESVGGSRATQTAIWDREDPPSLVRMWLMWLETVSG